MMKDIFKAINSKIKATFPGITIQSTDVKEGFSRPSFYVDFDNFETDSMNGSIKSEAMEIEIMYFPSDRYTYKIELIEVLQKLKAAFEGTLKINDKVKINILDTTAQKVDGVLIFAFEITIFNPAAEEQHPQGGEYEIMEELEIETEE